MAHPSLNPAAEAVCARRPTPRAEPRLLGTPSNARNIFVWLFEGEDKWSKWQELWHIAARSRP